MELDELKKTWREIPPEKQNTDIMELIRHKHYGPLAMLKRTYKRQVVVMSIMPLVLILANASDPAKVFTSILYWSYVAACCGMIAFALYNYGIVKRMQQLDRAVKENLAEQIALLEKRTRAEIWALRGVLLLFILLLEIVPYFQHYRMLDKWHSLPVLLRTGVYLAFAVYQYFINRQLKERRVGTHLTYLKELTRQME